MKMKFRAKALNEDRVVESETFFKTMEGEIYLGNRGVSMAAMKEKGTHNIICVGTRVFDDPPILIRVDPATLEVIHAE